METYYQTCGRRSGFITEPGIGAGVSQHRCRKMTGETASETAPPSERAPRRETGNDRWHGRQLSDWCGAMPNRCPELGPDRLAGGPLPALHVEEGTGADWRPGDRAPSSRRRVARAAVSPCRCESGSRRRSWTRRRVVRGGAGGYVGPIHPHRHDRLHPQRHVGTTQASRHTASMNAA